jgi:hypothetical protein
MATTPKTRQGSSAGLHGDFRVDVLGTQESLDLDCGKFYTVRRASSLTG